MHMLFCVPQVKGIRCIVDVQRISYIYSGDPCACSDQLYFERFRALAAGCWTAFKYIMVAFEMSVGDSLCKTSTKVREGGQKESWDG